jgi:GH15 family glucan-1,4-alpha-glucosidase
MSIATRLSTPEIQDYAIIGDCRTAALVSCAGSIDWLCVPDFSSPSLFAGLLDRERGGSFAIRPRGPFTAKRRYIVHTAVLATTFEADGGAIRVLDLSPVLDGMSPMQPMREVLRIIEGLAGAVEVRVRLDPRPDYGRIKARLQYRGRLGWTYTWRNEIIVVGSDVALHHQGEALEATVTIGAGERRYLSLSYTKGDPGLISLLGTEADDRVARTIRWWQAWAARCTYNGPYREEVIRSAITLKLLNYSLSGAIVAAANNSDNPSCGPYPRLPVAMSAGGREG